MRVLPRTWFGPGFPADNDPLYASATVPGRRGRRRMHPGSMASATLPTARPPRVRFQDFAPSRGVRHRGFRLPWREQDGGNQREDVRRTPLPIPAATEAAPIWQDWWSSFV